VTGTFTPTVGGSGGPSPPLCGVVSPAAFGPRGFLGAEP